jgi:hypothetical protein
MSGAASFSHASRLGRLPLMPLTLKVATRTGVLSALTFDGCEDNLLARSRFHKARYHTSSGLLARIAANQGGGLKLMAPV